MQIFNIQEQLVKPQGKNSHLATWRQIHSVKIQSNNVQGLWHLMIYAIWHELHIVKKKQHQSFQINPQGKFLPEKMAKNLCLDKVWLKFAIFASRMAKNCQPI